MTIVKLPDEIIAKISAGEVIARPFNILKELLENSIDAQATEISINISSSLLSLEIRDNGTGISSQDFACLCLPHHTSKLTALSQLTSLSSFGFRGEALSSISHCSKISVRSKQPSAECGTEAKYINTKLINSKKVASNDGTTICITDIFYNNKIREEYFRKRKNELINCLELVQWYAVCYIGIKFVLEIDYKTKFYSKGCQGTVGMIDKMSLLESLLKAECKLISHIDSKYILLFTSPSFALKKGVFVLFVNGRLVVNTCMKDSMFKVYKEILPKQKYPFIYAELYLDKLLVDVNVHPSKKEVLMIGEDELIHELVDIINDKLRHQDCKSETRVNHRSAVEGFQKVYAKPDDLLLFECGINEKRRNNDKSEANVTNGNSLDVSVPSSISLEDTRIRDMLDLKKADKLCESAPKHDNLSDTILTNYIGTIVPSELAFPVIKEFSLSSLKRLRSEMIEVDEKFFKSLVFVGASDNALLVQHGPSLLGAEVFDVLKEYFYQRIIMNFGNFKKYKLKSNLKIIKTRTNEADSEFPNLESYKFIRNFSELEELEYQLDNNRQNTVCSTITYSEKEYRNGYTNTNDQYTSESKKADTVEKATKCNYSRSGEDAIVCKSNPISDNVLNMLDDYFSIEIQNGRIISVPVISERCVDIESSWLEFTFEYGTEYSTIKEISISLATIYAKRCKCCVKFFNLMKRTMLGTKKAIKCFYVVTTLKELYKNFERC